MSAAATPAAAPAPFALLDEIDADLHDACAALQALMALLRGCDPGQPIPAGQLRGLLQPIASGIHQASQSLAVIHH